MSITFQEHYMEIKNSVQELGTNLLEANTLLLEALQNCDTDTFTQAKTTISNMNAKTDDIDNAIIKILALYTPEAIDLRHIVAYLKISNELSRGASSTRSYIRGFTDVCKDVDVETISEFAVPMQKATVNAISIANAMLECNDADEIQEMYNEVLIEENKTDDLYEIVERNLSQDADGTCNFEKFHKMLRALRKSGKIANRSVSIANLLVYARIGGSIRS